MTDFNPNFANEEKILNSAIEINNRFSARNPEIDTAPVQDGDTEVVCKYIVKAPRPDSKLILQNMEEVLNSVKKKHRQKHKRKREQRKLAEMEAAAVAEATTELEKADGPKDSNIDNEKLIEKTFAQSGISQNDKKNIEKRSKTKPLQEKTVQENEQEVLINSSRKSKHLDNKSLLKTPSPDGDILRHFQCTPKKSQFNVDSMTSINDAKTSTAVNLSKTMNAFEVMMNARNKTIGSNTPGKEASPSNSQESTVNTKRKLILQAWAERKGGAKRKLEEETRAAYVEHELENRAKRLKQMLVEGVSPVQDNTTTSRTSSDRGRKAKKTSSEKLANQSIEKVKLKKRTAKRLISVESTDNEEVVEPDVETEEFLSKLNSPTKKRDSILGYFPRKESQTDIAEKNVKENIAKSKNLSKPETPKKRTRRSTKNSAVQATETSNKTATPATEEKLQNVEVTIQEPAGSTPSGRPKRSCAGKARYDYDLETSPIKVNSNSTKKYATKAKQGETSINEEVIIDLDDSNMSLSPEKLPMKLAPVFVRAIPKPSPDPVALKARQDFLMSGVPEKMRLEMDKQKQYEQTYEEELDYFPRVCHIQQLTLDDTKFLDIKCDFNFKLKPCADDDDFEIRAAVPSLIMSGKGRKRRSNSNTGSTKKMKALMKADLSLKKITPPMCIPLPTVENKRAIIKFWKSEFDRFPTFKCYNQMREKYRFFSALDSAQDMEQVSESFVVTRRSQRKRNTEVVSSNIEQDDVKPPATAPNGELLFTEKYKPMLVEQVLVNLVPVTQLRDFLATWVNGNGGSARNSQTMDDTLDTSNDSTTSISNATSNAVVLLGPVSSGKTNAVYALANDMNFNVLEINAGMKRTGKRLIQELQEATQSHQIRKGSTPAQSASKAQKNLLRMSLNGQKLKKQSSQSPLEADSNGGCNADVAQNTRKCLILIEDADVVFDQLDSGFTDAIYTLAASSKRPVIAMATNPNCMHLQRLMNQNTIHFTPPNALNISRFMAVLSLIENCPINLDDLVSLYLYNGKDLRRTLLELQFFIQSGGDRRLTAAAANVKGEPQQRTPQKVEGIRRESSFFASPTKRRLSDDNSQQSHEQDEQLRRGDNNKSSTNDVYIHRSLFEYFTCDQNEQYRIPFPVDFSLLRVNLSEMFQCSQRLQVYPEWVTENSEKDTKIVNEKLSATKRRTRTPKKTGINSSATQIQENYRETTKPPLDVLCDFYENISIAALLGTHNADMSEGRGGAVYRNGITGGGADIGVDRLMPHLSEHIAHGIVEEAISVNLKAKPCPYNLFNTRTERLSLCDYMNSSAISSRSQRTRALDVEPALRAICRSERQRAMQERRSTRFYHYLRHSAVNVSNFSMEPFDKACFVLQLNTLDDVEEESVEARD